MDFIYLPDLGHRRTAHSISGFAVFPEYVITNRKGKRLITVSDTTSDTTSDTAGETEPGNDMAFHFGTGIPYKLYYPENFKSIYTRLATVTDEKSLLRFVHQYGLLGTTRRYLPHDLTPLAINAPITEDQVNLCLDEANVMRYILESWIDAQNGISINRAMTGDYLYTQWSSLQNDIDDITQTRAYLALRVTNYITGVRPVANFTPEGKLIPGFGYLSLSDAIWHQLYQDMISHEKFKECPRCKSWHTGRGRFCPSPPNYKRSPCENSYNQKKIYRKKKEAQSNGR